MPDPDDAVDFALAAYREDGDWRVAELAHDQIGDVVTLARALRRLPGDGGALGLVALDEDVFVVVRVAGASTRVLLSDVAAADEFELAGSVLELLGLPLVDPLADEEDEEGPVGDVGLLADLGLRADELAALLDDDDELYADELLSEVALRLGFGPQFDDAVGLTSA